MIELFNHLFFRFLNATPASPAWAIDSAIFIAKYPVIVVPVLMVALWFWGDRTQIFMQRTLVSKSAIALIFSMSLSALIGVLYPHARPFVENFGYNFLPHAPTPSFPSNHATGMFTVALVFLCWHRVWSGLLMLALALAVSWARVYLGVHWPLDILGGALVAIVGCLFTHWLWELYGTAILSLLLRLYRFCFAWPIKKGWLQE